LASGDIASKESITANAAADKRPAIGGFRLHMWASRFKKRWYARIGAYE